MPQTLLDRYAPQPLVLALYALYTHLWMCWDRPGGVPVSDADLLRLCPDLTRTSLIVARQHLLDGGWLIKTAGSKKSTWTPGWGKDRQGAVRPWQRTKGFDRRSVKTLRIPTALLDWYVGRLLCHPSCAAPVERYTETPLSLHALGSYLYLLRGNTCTPEAQRELEQAGLLRDGVLQPPTIMHLAARPLTVRGIQRIIREITQRAAQLVVDPTRPEGPRPTIARLFFWSQDMTLLLTLVLTQILVVIHTEQPAQEAAKQPNQAVTANPTWMQYMKDHPTDDSPLPPTEQPAIGVTGEDSPGIRSSKRLSTTEVHNDHAPNRRRGAARPKSNIMSNKEAWTLLDGLGVSVPSLRRWGTSDPTVVAAVIERGRTLQVQGRIRDLAGWVVTVLADVAARGWDTVQRAWRDLDQRRDAQEPTDWAARHAQFARYFTRERVAPGASPDPKQSVAAPDPQADQRSSDPEAIVRPPWIDPAIWQTLAMPYRWALQGAQRTPTTIHAADGARQHWLERNPALLDQLLAGGV